MKKSFSIEIPGNISNLDQGDEATAPVSLKGLVDIFFRRFRLITLGFLATFLAIAFFTFNQTPLYNATAQIMVNTSEKNVINIAGVMGGLGADTSVIDTEVKVIESTTLLRKVAIKYSLIEAPEFNPYIREQKASLLDGVRDLLGLKKKEVADPFDGLSEEEIQSLQLEKTIDILSGRVNVSRVGTTFILIVQVTSETPDMAATLANGIAEQYRTNQLDQKLEATKVATNWLSQNVEELEREVLQKQRRVEEYRASSGLLEAAGTRLTEQNLAFLESDRSQIRSDLIKARSKLENVENTIAAGGDVTSLAEVLDSRVIADLKIQRAAILRRQADLQVELGFRHPDMIRIRSEVADIEAQIDTEIDRIVDRLRSAVSIVERQLTEKTKQINASKLELTRNNANTVELDALERDARTSEELYEEFLSRFKETRPQNEITEADARLLSRARTPRSPSSPNTILNLLVGIILGGLIGGGLALLAEVFDNKISSGQDVRRKLGASLIGSIPQITHAGILGLFSKSPADYLVDNPFTAYAESIRYLRVAIAFSDPDNETKTVAITSSLPDEGKTSMTLSLGRMSAMSGSRTLVIDGDFRRRQLTKSMGAETQTGLVEYLAGEGTLENVIVKDERTDLHLFPLSQHGQTPHDVFGTKAFDELLAQLRDQYDLILIDTGPLLLMAETRVVAGKCDKTILVVRWRATAQTAAKQSLEHLRKFRANLIGVTLSRVDLSRHRYHQDPSATTKAYKKYYLQDPSVFSFKKLFKRSKSNKTFVNPEPSFAQMGPDGILDRIGANRAEPFETVIRESPTELASNEELPQSPADADGARDGEIDHQLEAVTNGETAEGEENSGDATEMFARLKQAARNLQDEKEAI
ncbi:MAG: polysaccharide biosynthesis tyrosine autokinase [Pseudomonadota bacterium]